MTPFIYEASRYFEVYYLLLSPELLPERDFRLRSLSEREGVKIITIFDFPGFPGIKGRLGIRKLWSILPKSVIWKRVLDKFTPIVFGAVNWDKILQEYLKQIEPVWIVADRLRPDKESSKKKKYTPYGKKGVFEFASNRKNHLKVLSIPHGLLLFDLPTSYELFRPFYDKVAVSNMLEKKKFNEAGFSDRDLWCVGATRYASSWLEYLEKIVPAVSYADKIGKDRYIIVFFATKMVYEYDFERLLTWLKVLSEIENVFVIVQPHPRGQKRKAFKALESCENVFIDTVTPAASLIRFSDAVSTLVSSVVVEAICLEKPLFYPKFLHKKQTAFEKEGACITIDDLQKTEEIVLGVKNGKSPLPTEKYKNFLKRYLYCSTEQNANQEIVKEMIKERDE